MRVRDSDGSSEGTTLDITVLDYFTKHCGIQLSYSAYLPCLDVGRPKRPNYLPLEVCFLFVFLLVLFVLVLCQGFLCTHMMFWSDLCLVFIFQLCSLVSLQRYTKSLNSMQRASLVEKSRQKPQDRMKTVTDVSSVVLLTIYVV